MIRNIVSVSEKKLRKKSKPVAKIDKKIKALIKDLKETLAAQTDPEGVGLAAPQIGTNLRVFVMRPEEKIKVFINAKLVKVSSKKGSAKNESGKRIMEGCLSLPHFYGPLGRPKKVTVSYLDEKGEKQKKAFTGLKAQIVQHEIDHLNGVLFVDRLIEQKKPLYEYSNDEWEKVQI